MFLKTKKFTLFKKEDKRRREKEEKKEIRRIEKEIKQGRRIEICKKEEKGGGIYEVSQITQEIS